MKDETVYCLRFPAGSEPICLPGPPVQAMHLNGHSRPRVSRDRDTVTVCAMQWEWAEWLFVVKALGELGPGENVACHY